MGFTMPGAGNGASDNQSIWMVADLEAIAAAYAGTDVLDGCAVTAQGSPNMTVAVAAGNVRIAGTIYGVTGGNGTITTADATNPRIDLISINTSGAIVVTAGTPAASPAAPAIPASHALLAMVYVPAADTTIATNQITDKRMINGQSLVHLETITPTGTTATFSKLGAFKHLEIRWSARGTQAAIETAITAQFNADGGANYDLQTLYGVNASPGAVESLAQTSAQVATVVANSGTADAAATGILFLPDYRGTTFHKAGSSLNVLPRTTASANFVNLRYDFRWRSTAAITSIVYTLASGNFATGSTFSLYGVQ